MKQPQRFTVRDSGELRMLRSALALLISQEDKNMKRQMAAINLYHKINFAIKKL